MPNAAQSPFCLYNLQDPSQGIVAPILDVSSHLSSLVRIIPHWHAQSCFFQVNLDLDVVHWDFPSQ